MLPTPTEHLPVPLDADGASLLGHLESTWALEEVLLGALSPETLEVAPDPLRRKLIFYYGHTAAFFTNKMRMAGLLVGAVDERLDELFAKGVDPATPSDLERLRFPPSAEVRAYREATLGRVTQVLEAHRSRPVDATDPMWSVWMAIAHARIHIETSSVLVRQLPLELLQRPSSWCYAESFGDAPANTILNVDAGTACVGRPAGVGHFGWDNEYGQLIEDVAPFEVTRNLISNQELREFAVRGGYEDQRLWTEEGWSWRERTATTHPKFWREVSPGEFRYRAIFDELPLSMDWPAEVNCHEARAYCAFHGEGWSLPTEAQHLRLADEGDVTEGGWNNGLSYGSPIPVGQTGRADGCSDVWGNLWQWLHDDFRPLPGFRPHRLYEDFSAPYFDSHHAAMIGGSWCSLGSTASRWYRLWFRRHFFQHAGFRMTRAL